MKDLFKPAPHIQFSQSLTCPIIASLSDSCAEPLSIQALNELSNDTLLPSLLQKNLGYASLQGSETLRQRIADSTGLADIKAENVLTCCGAQEAIFMAMTYLLEPGDEVITITPCYPSLYSLTQQTGVHVHNITLEFDNQWAFPVEHLISLINKKTKLIVLNTPQNPTGASLSQQQLAAITQQAALMGCWILYDGVSALTRLDESSTDENNNQTISDSLNYERAININVMSKSYGQPGIRIGWLTCQDKHLLNALIPMKSYLSICTSSTDEMLAATVLEHRETIIARNNNIARKNIQAIDTFMQQNQQYFSWHKPSSGLLTLIKSHLDEDSHSFARRFAEATSILLLPGDLFFMDGNFFRLGFGRTHVPDSLAALDTFLGSIDL